jgi:hypothetical protein
MKSVIGRLVFARQLAWGAGALSIAMGLVVLTERVEAQSPFPAPVQTQTPRIVGQWTGKTQEDGILTLVVYPAPGRELTYEFSGGKQEHGAGTFTLRGANELNFTPKGAKEVEKWTYTFDEDGHLHLKMEEDKPEDEEEYVLSRAGQ